MCVCGGMHRFGYIGVGYVILRACTPVGSGLAQWLVPPRRRWTLCWKRFFFFLIGFGWSCGRSGMQNSTCRSIFDGSAAVCCQKNVADLHDKKTSYTFRQKSKHQRRVLMTLMTRRTLRRGFLCLNFAEVLQKFRYSQLPVLFVVQIFPVMG